MQPLHRRSCIHAARWLRITLVALVITISCLVWIYFTTRQAWYQLYRKTEPHQTLKKIVSQLEQEVSKLALQHTTLQQMREQAEKTIASNRVFIGMILSLYQQAAAMNIVISSLIMESSLLEMSVQAKSVRHVYNFIESIEQKQKLKLTPTEIRQVDATVIATLQRAS